MSDPTTALVPAGSGVVTVPLRSDPAWLGRGVLGVTLLCIAVFALYFRLLPGERPPLALAVLPGLAVGTFASAWLAWWSRRHGGTMQLESRDDRLVLVESARRAEVLDRAMPFGAMLVADAATGRRILVLSQHGEPAMVLDTRRAEVPGGLWERRTLKVDLTAVALSPATAHVLTVRTRDTLDPLLRALESDLSLSTPLLLYTVLSGEVLLVTREDVRLGSRVLPVGPETTARRITVQAAGGEAAAISLVSGAHSLLLACLDPNDAPDGQSAAEAPDAYLPALPFAVVAALFGLDVATHTVAAKPYRG